MRGGAIIPSTSTAGRTQKAPQSASLSPAAAGMARRMRQRAKSKMQHRAALIGRLVEERIDRLLAERRLTIRFCPRRRLVRRIAIDNGAGPVNQMTNGAALLRDSLLCSFAPLRRRCGKMPLQRPYFGIEAACNLIEGGTIFRRRQWICGNGKIAIGKTALAEMIDIATGLPAQEILQHLGDVGHHF